MKSFISTALLKIQDFWKEIQNKFTKYLSAERVLSQSLILVFFFLNLSFWQWTVATTTAVWSLRRRTWWTWRWRVARCLSAGKACSCTRGTPWCETTRYRGRGCCTWASSTWLTRISGIAPAFTSSCPQLHPSATKLLPGRQGWYLFPTQCLWHGDLVCHSPTGSQCLFYFYSISLNKVLQSSHTATSLVFAFKAIMWKFGLWFWYIHCSWICYEQNLYLNICYKLIIRKHRTPLFFFVVTNLTLPDFKQVPQTDIHCE